MRIPIVSNPIFQRDFVALSRLKRWYILRTSALALLAGLIMLFFLGMANEFDSGDLDEIGMALFAVCAFTQTAFVFFVTPGLTADLIVNERRKDTLEILLVTRLRPTGIVLGKLISRLCLVLVIVAASFPFVSISLLFGGVRGDQVLGLALVTLGTMFFTAGPSLYISALARRLGTAAVLAYVIPIVYLIVSPFVTFAWLGRGTIDDGVRLSIVTHPVLATASVALPDDFARMGTARTAEFALYYCLFGFTVCVITTSLAILRLAREKRNRGLGKPRKGLGKSARQQLVGLRVDLETRLGASTSLNEIDRAIARLEAEPGSGERPVSEKQIVRDLTTTLRETGGTVGEEAAAGLSKRSARRRRRWFRGMKNPMLWKEAHLVNASHSRALVRVLFTMFVLAELCVLIFVPARDLVRDEEIHYTIVTIQACLLVLTVAVNGSMCVVGERQQGTLELLRVTLLEPGQITRAKVLGTIRSVAILAAIPILHFLLASIFGDVRPVSFFAFLTAFTVILVFFAVSGVRASILATRPSRAVLRTMGLLAFATVGTGIAAIIPLALRTGEDVVYFIISANPVSAIIAPAAILQDATPPRDAMKYLSFTVIWLLVYVTVALLRWLRLPATYRHAIEKAEE